MLENVVCLILGGGRGTRLFPLTRDRAKPAVPLAGNYRLIDIPISNCLNCGINRIYLLTQFLSVSLHRHVRQTFKFDRFGGGFVEILAAQQSIEGDGWYQGTADAVRQQLQVIRNPDVEYVLVLSGDQLYRMDFGAMLRNHCAAGRDATIAALPVTDEQARGFGVMRLDDDFRVAGFIEKPQTADELQDIRTDPDWIDQHGIASNGRSLLASMGIYLFKRDVLVKLLEGSDYTDFAKEVFPMSIPTHHVGGYWEDIGTIRAFYDCNLALAKANPPFELSDESAPIFTRPRFLAPTRVLDATVRGSMIANGGLIEDGAVVEDSIVGLRTHIGQGAQVRRSILMGADHYQDATDTLADNGAPRIGIGAGSVIEDAIIDKDCRIGRNVRVRMREGLGEDEDIKGVNIRDGIIVVPKGTVLPDNWEL